VTIQPPEDFSDLAGQTFEELMASLEDVARRMESREIGIEQAADLYEQAGRLHRAAVARLDAVEQRIQGLRPSSS
jgi:exodeoxyribonuclease VII small subunit